MADRNTIIDLFNQYAPGVPQSVIDDAINRFADLSAYQVKQYIMHNIAEYRNSTEYAQRYSQIQQLAANLFGRYLEPAYIDSLIRREYSDDQILYIWRNSEEYKKTYIGKPPEMSEAEYRKKAEDYWLYKDQVRSDFETYLGRTPTEEEVRNVFFGRVTDPAKLMYARIAEAKKSYEAAAGRRTTETQLTPFGPIQPLMRGMDVGQVNVPGKYSDESLAGELPGRGKVVLFPEKISYERYAPLSPDTKMQGGYVKSEVPKGSIYSSYKNFYAHLYGERTKPLS